MNMYHSSTEKPVALRFLIEFELGKVGFCGGRKTLETRTRTDNKLNPHMTPGLGIETKPHWWEESALTTAPSLLPLPPVLLQC